MPAVDLTRLKIQLDGLSWRITRPEEFVQELNAVFSHYADRVYRPGEQVIKKHIVQAYRIPPLVFRQTELELKQRFIENPTAALILADILWQENMFEPKLFAAVILGTLPSEKTDEINQRLVQWSQQTTDVKILYPILEKSTQRLRQEQPEVLLQILKKWSGNSDLAEQRLVLLLMLVLLQYANFDNLPPLLDMLTVAIKLHPQALQQTLLDVFTQLIQRSPLECAYFLRQLIWLGTPESSASLLRKIIAQYDEPTRSSLLTEMRSGSSPNLANEG